jgi:hypothetical protein
VIDDCLSAIWYKHPLSYQAVPFGSRANGQAGLRTGRRRILSGIMHVIKVGVAGRIARPNMVHTRQSTIALRVGVRKRQSAREEAGVAQSGDELCEWQYHTGDVGSARLRSPCRASEDLPVRQQPAVFDDGQRAPCGAAMSLSQKAYRKIVAKPVLGGLHHIYGLAE